MSNGTAVHIPPVGTQNRVDLLNLMATLIADARREVQGASWSNAAAGRILSMIEATCQRPTGATPGGGK